MGSKSGPLPARCNPCGQEYDRSYRRQRLEVLAAQRVLRKIFCVDCNEELPWEGKSRPRLRCTPCLAEWTRAEGRRRSLKWIQADPKRAQDRDKRGYDRRAEKIRRAKLDDHYRRKYGLERGEMERMLAAQDGKCLICAREPDPNAKPQYRRLHVDHCHTSGKVRGLLCGNCNTMIGLAGEDPARLLAAAHYLQQFTKHN